jgi:hypothetical protein
MCRALPATGGISIRCPGRPCCTAQPPEGRELYLVFLHCFNAVQHLCRAAGLRLPLMTSAQPWGFQVRFPGGSSLTRIIYLNCSIVDSELDFLTSVLEKIDQ